MSNQICLYTQPNCGPCVGAKAFLLASGADFITIDITMDAEAAARLKRNGFTGTPVVGYQGHLYTVDRLRDIIAGEL